MELIERSGQDARSRVGGKGSKLQELRALGLPVPPFFIVPAGASIDETELLNARRRLTSGPVAVRSSATQEDAAGLSFAGQFDTRLCVESDADFLDAVRQIRGSVSSERLDAYASRHGISLAQIQMAVVVQAMFPSEAAGVMFTADPADPSADDILISAGWGLGEGIVSGQVEADTVRVRSAGITTEIAVKSLKVVRAVGGGTHEAPVTEADSTRACLTEAQVTVLAGLGRQLEAHYGLPQDIEWAVDAAGQIAILQTRPLTGVGPRAGIVYTWDNSNIVESYSGVTTPLTYSFARAAYETVYRQFCEVMGVSRSEIEANASVFKSMIGLIRGRVYYRLDSWYRALTLLPGAKYNRRFMEQMMGVNKQAELGGSSGAGKFKLIYLVYKMLAALGSLGRRTTLFRATFDRVYGAWHGGAGHSKVGPNLEAQPAEALVAGYRDLEREILLEWKAPIINDFFAMIFFGVLKKLAPDHYNDLLCGEPGMESTLPTRSILQMAADVRNSRPMSVLFEDLDDAGILRAIRIPTDRAYLHAAPLRSWLHGYLDRYGDRCMEELKLETPTLRDDPVFLITTLRNYIARADLTLHSMEAREQTVRRAAERAVHVPLLRKPLFNWILRRTRRHVRERENLRFARTRIFGLVRRIFRAIGQHLERFGLLESGSDVFYLTVDEAIGLVEGTTTTTHVKPLVAARKEEFARYRTLPAPAARFETHGGVHFGNTFVGATVQVPVGDEPDVLHGLGCAPGVVRAEARIVYSPKDDVRLNGQILVCERTDPGWVPLFPTAGGLLVERGSALSHSAIVAREFGIPTVVGIPGLMARVTDRQLVELDGKTGRVRLSPPPIE